MDWRRQWHPAPVLLPGKSHGRRSLVGYSPWGCEESDVTEWLPFHFSLSCIGEGNGNPLQCSCRENPRDGGAWWAAVCRVAQSQTWLKWLSSSSSKVDDAFSRITYKQLWKLLFIKRMQENWHDSCHMNRDLLVRILLAAIDRKLKNLRKKQEMYCFIELKIKLLINKQFVINHLTRTHEICWLER